VSDRSPLKATDGDASARECALEPPAGGTCFRIIEIAPGDAGAASDGEAADAVHGFKDGDWHATETVDYVTIIRGHVTLVAGDAEVTLGPGDSVVQQPGVRHNWQNRSGEPAVMVAALVSAR
jgi:mannose-6-phosphate isomerase-like protein (cupin superfamily)